MRSTVTALLLTAFAGSHATAVSAQQPQTPPSGASCCGMGQWPMGHGMMMGPGNTTMLRHRTAMMNGVPAPYRSLSNPLPSTSATVGRGAEVYTQNCAACHGATGQGDGPAGRGLSPPPANLAWLSQMPMFRSDPFIYWTIAEGGASLGTAMPSFKETLSKQDIWAVITYVQAQLPPVPKP